MQRITLKQIAELAQVSKSTVSLILNDKAKQNRISQETLLRVQQVIEENGFIINNQAKCFRMKKTFAIGVVVPDLENPFFARLVSNIEKSAKEKGYLSIIGTSDDQIGRQELVVNRFLEHAVDGLVIVSASEKPTQVVPAYVSVVYLDRKVNVQNVPTVTTNHRESAYSMTNFLLEHSLQNILFLNGEKSLVTSKERFLGFEDAFRIHSLELAKAEIVYGAHNKESGYQMARTAWKHSGGIIDCIYTTSWSLMEGVLEFLKTLPALPPHLVLATFDHHSILDYFPLRSVSIRQDAFSLGVKSFTTLYKLINKGPFELPLDLTQEISAQLITKNFFK